MVDPTQFIKQIGAALHDGGRVGQLDIVRANGERVALPFSSESMSSIMLAIERAIGTLLDAQRKMLGGQDPRAFFPIAAKQVSRIQGAVSGDGRPILSLVLSTGVRLDFLLDQTILRDLIAWLQDLEEAGQKPQSVPH